ncbi:MULTISPECIES: helix-turn-helix domain-containing protein [Shewanella]|uniref:Helix-turn-helix transcriptional regulator n=1 Tax=Shewanella scandinavica TaxID=3063538 RepID=A0ABU3G6W8_9GAMM|nr:helix-turn-helix transcriptional regulator [Shewanella sp. SP2S1-2]MDT3282993.1 helix-turn-helix transcriptional regulator [Shewanella sp. SP2S1-2]
MKNEKLLDMLGNDPVQLNMISLKVKLMLIITAFIEENKWNQAQAADKLCVSQPRVSNLVNGKISRFSIDMLLEILGKLGYLMDITFNPEEGNNPINVRIRKTAA